MSKKVTIILIAASLAVKAMENADSEALDKRVDCVIASIDNLVGETNEKQRRSKINVDFLFDEINGYLIDQKDMIEKLESEVVEKTQEIVELKKKLEACSCTKK
jgi:dihydroxyacetone kinase